MSDLEFRLDQDSNLPYYLQIKNNIRQFIEKGQWTSGSKLPTERDLAKRLNVSRNTVSMAYKELVAEGYLFCRQGRGTFVAELNTHRGSESNTNGANYTDIEIDSHESNQNHMTELEYSKNSRKEQILKMIDHNIEKALELGFSIEDFLAITHVRAREKQDNLSQLKIAFIECNQEQVNCFVKDLQLEAGVSVVPILLKDLKLSPETYRSELKDVGAIVTTFFHVGEIKELLGELNIDIIPIALELQLESVVKIARFPAGANVGLVCISDNFANKFFNSLKKAGINHINFTYTTATSEKELISFVNSVDEVVSSPGRKKHIRPLVGEDKHIGEVIFKPDHASLNLLKSTLLDLKQNVS